MYFSITGPALSRARVGLKHWQAFFHSINANKGSLVIIKRYRVTFTDLSRVDLISQVIPTVLNDLHLGHFVENYQKAFQPLLSFTAE